jgi:ankyrin repeat protein
MESTLPILPSPIDSFIQAILHKDISFLMTLIHESPTVDRRGTYGETPLMWAVDEGWIAGIHALLAAGADPKAESTFGATPLLIVTEVSYDGDTEILLEHNGRSYLVERIYHEIKSLLETAGASIHDKNQDGYAPYFHRSYGVRRMWQAWAPETDA